MQSNPEADDDTVLTDLRLCGRVEPEDSTSAIISRRCHHEPLTQLNYLYMHVHPMNMEEPCSQVHKLK